MRMEKNIGETVEIIYLGCDNRITQRRIKVRDIANGYCLDRNAPRLFRLGNILDMQPVIRHAV